MKIEIPFNKIDEKFIQDLKKELAEVAKEKEISINLCGEEYPGEGPIFISYNYREVSSKKGKGTAHVKSAGHLEENLATIRRIIDEVIAANPHIDRVNLSLQNPDWGPSVAVVAGLLKHKVHLNVVMHDLSETPEPADERDLKSKLLERQCKSLRIKYTASKPGLAAGFGFCKTIIDQLAPWEETEKDAKSSRSTRSNSQPNTRVTFVTPNGMVYENVTKIFMEDVEEPKWPGSEASKPKDKSNEDKDDHPLSIEIEVVHPKNMPKGKVKPAKPYAASMKPKTKDSSNGKRVKEGDEKDAASNDREAGNAAGAVPMEVDQTANFGTTGMVTRSLRRAQQNAQSARFVPPHLTLPPAPQQFTPALNVSQQRPVRPTPGTLKISELQPISNAEMLSMHNDIIAAYSRVAELRKSISELEEQFKKWNNHILLQTRGMDKARQNHLFKVVKANPSKPDHYDACIGTEEKLNTYYESYKDQSDDTTLLLVLPDRETLKELHDAVSKLLDVLISYSMFLPADIAHFGRQCRAYNIPLPSFEDKPSDLSHSHAMTSSLGAGSQVSMTDEKSLPNVPSQHSHSHSNSAANNDGFSNSNSLSTSHSSSTGPSRKRKEGSAQDDDAEEQASKKQKSDKGVAVKAPPFSLGKSSQPDRDSGLVGVKDTSLADADGDAEMVADKAHSTDAAAEDVTAAVVVEGTVNDVDMTPILRL